jgi:hypothetical protein
MQVLILKRLKMGGMHQKCAGETDFSESAASVENERLRTVERWQKAGIWWPQSRSRKIYERYYTVGV